jgi:hypothetical protein
LLALNAGRKRRLLDDTPVSKALGVFVGEVVVNGPFPAGAAVLRLAVSLLAPPPGPCAPVSGADRLTQRPAPP